MTTTLLTLIRHGHTDWNELGRYQGHAPIPLSELGQAQARCLAGALAADGTVRAVYSSDLKRCRQTAEPVAAALGLPLRCDARLRELDYGNWQGLTRAELIELDAEAFVRHHADPFNEPVPGGESQRILASRALAALNTILADHAGQHVVIVTHGGPLREILRHFLLWQGGHPPGNASRTVLAVQGDGRLAEARLLGDVTHLPDALRPAASGTSFVAL